MFRAIPNVQTSPACRAVPLRFAMINDCLANHATTASAKAIHNNLLPTPAPTPTTTTTTAATTTTTATKSLRIFIVRITEFILLNFLW